MRPLLAFIGLLASAAAGAQTVLPAGSEIRFVTKQMGVPVEGRFPRWQAQVAFDPRQLQASQVTLAIDTRSIAFGAADTEAEAAKPAWFHSAQLPQAQFKSASVKALGSGRFEVAGALSIKGQTREVVVPVALAAGPAAGQGTAMGSFTLRRMDFKLGEGEWSDLSVVANDVHVHFKLQRSGWQGREAGRRGPGAGLGRRPSGGCGSCRLRAHAHPQLRALRVAACRAEHAARPFRQGQRAGDDGPRRRPGPRADRTAAGLGEHRPAGVGHGVAAGAGGRRRGHGPLRHRRAAHQQGSAGGRGGPLQLAHGGAADHAAGRALQLLPEPAVPA